MIKIPLDFFSDSIKNQTDRELLKGIRNLKKRIKEHEKKIARPEVLPGWNELSYFAQQGTTRTWKKEIVKVQGNIAKCETELEGRKKCDK